MALGVAQRLLLDLGDLARYRLQYCGPGHAGANSALPHRWYQLASRLYPRNGRPFHQLAILSVTQKRPLDVFYFYVRSLMAANPFVSAKDSLTSFFEGIRTRFTALKEELDCRPPSPRNSDQVMREGALHRELWYRLDGSNATKRRTCTLPAAQPSLLDPIAKLVDTLPSDQLMKQFLTCFLHCHGLLFSRVSLEEFDACCRRCLLLFAALLQCTPARLSGTHLLQVLALNMFAVRSTQLHDTSLGQGYRSAAQELALLLSQEMFGRLAQHVASVLPQSINTNPNVSPEISVTSNDNPAISLPVDLKPAVDISSGSRSKHPSSTSSDSVTGPPITRSRTNSSCEQHVDASPRGSHNSEVPPSDPFDVVGMTWLLDEAEEPAPQPEQKPRLLLPATAHLVPALKVWCDWLLYNSSLWHPPPSNTDFTSQWFDSWSSVAELATILHGIGEADVPIFTAADVAVADRPVEFIPLVLDEDKFLRGYDPLLASHNLPPMFTDDPTAVARACDWVRLQQLQTVLGKFLCGLEPPVLRLQKTLQGDVLIPAISSPTPSPPPELLSTPAQEVGSATKSDDKEDSGDDEDSSEGEPDQLEENPLSGDDSMASNINATLRMLWQRKHQMDKYKKRLERKKARKSQSVGVELEVRPRYVVPDTNCFITHLQYLTALVAHPSPYTLLVPLVVVRELEGLSRGGDCPRSLEEVGEVVDGVPRAEWARLAREFVRSRKHNIKAVTTQGSILGSSDFQEAIVDEMSNDDKILSSCQHFCVPDVTRSTSGGGVLHVKCEVVLLTADRNLAIKAYAANVPVCSVLYFWRWAEQSSSSFKYEGGGRGNSRGGNSRGGGGGNSRGGGGSGGNSRGGGGNSRGGGGGNQKDVGNGNQRGGGGGNPRGGSGGNQRGGSVGNQRGSGGGSPRNGRNRNPRNDGREDSRNRDGDNLRRGDRWNLRGRGRNLGNWLNHNSGSRSVGNGRNAGKNEDDGVHRSDDVRSSSDCSGCGEIYLGQRDRGYYGSRNGRRMERTNSICWDRSPQGNYCSRKRSYSVGKNPSYSPKYSEPVRFCYDARKEMNSTSKSVNLKDDSHEGKDFKLQARHSVRRASGSKFFPGAFQCGNRQSNASLDNKYICNECCELIPCSTYQETCPMCSKRSENCGSSDVGYTFSPQDQHVNRRRRQSNGPIPSPRNCFSDPLCGRTLIQSTRRSRSLGQLKLDNLEISFTNHRRTRPKVDDNNNLLSLEESDVPFQTPKGC